MTKKLLLNKQTTKRTKTIANVFLLGVSTAIAVNENLSAPAMSVMQFAGSMEMVIISHLMIRGLTSMDNVNTHLYRYVCDERL